MYSYTTLPDATSGPHEQETETRPLTRARGLLYRRPRDEPMGHVPRDETSAAMPISCEIYISASEGKESLRLVNPTICLILTFN